MQVSRIVRELHDEFGGAIPVDTVISRASQNSLDEMDVREALSELENDGLITWIDEDTIEFD